MFLAEISPRLGMYGWRDGERRGPTASQIQEYWQPRHIDSMSISFQGKKKATIQIPVLAWAMRAPETARDLQDPSWVAEQIARAAAAEQTESARELQQDGWTLSLSVESHKWEALDIGKEFCVRSCRSERPAFCLLASKDGSRVQLQHVYCAMGLRYSSAMQQTVLARVSSHDMGRSVLLAGKRLLGFTIWRPTVDALADLDEPERQRWVNFFLDSDVTLLDKRPNSKMQKLLYYSTLGNFCHGRKETHVLNPYWNDISLFQS